MQPKFPVAFELFYAVFEGTVTDVVERLKQGDSPNALSALGTTPIAHAVRSSRDLPKAEVLLAAGADINVWDHCGLHPLHWAANSPFDDTSCVAWLLDHGAGANVAVRIATDYQYHPGGWTGLHVAVRASAVHILRLLIKSGADVNYRAADGAAPIHIAARQCRAYKRLIRALIDAGADMNAQDCAGNTPLHDLASGCARYRKTAIRLLRSRGVRLDLRDAHGRLPSDVVRDDTPATAAIRALLQSSFGGPP